ncbi:VIT and vWA domain-containing protein [Granulicoccus phenolivorans]|uniref:VIT and vWA domain-containing protein n=1 Tax=Granulicoccus phenolivorans TaxID=266854 RepID=UPI00040F414F|nr:VIT and VWA domain-containing protein [Granulicoccus phenolivorans]
MIISRLPLPDPPRTAEPWGLRAEDGPLPLSATALAGTVTGLSAGLTLTQSFRNDRAVPIEVSYTFPLPDRFAVTGLTAVLGGRKVTGVLRERDAARRAYAEAMDRGERTALVEQDGEDMFTMQVGNLLPGEEATVRLELAGQLAIDDGRATLRVPLVVAERYRATVTLPRMTDDDDRPRLDVDIRVRPAGLDPAELAVAGDLIATPDEDGIRLTVPPGTRLHHDLILRLGLAPQQSRAGAVLAADADDPTTGTWQVTVTPDATVPSRRRSVVLVLDRSGSMGGWKIVAARRAAARIVDSLGAHDEFAVLAFDHLLEPQPGTTGLKPATDANRFAATRWLSALESRGGTEMQAPLAAAADLLREATGEPTLVLVTDGQVGHEARILQEVRDRLRGTRIFTLGIDRAVNEAFLRRLAAAGGGRCDLVESEEELDRVLTALHRRIAAPQLEGLTVALTGLTLERGASTPALADLFPAGPAVLTGRWSAPEPVDPATVGVRVLGQDPAGDLIELPAPVTVRTDAVLRTSWARRRVRDLEDELAAGGPVQPDEITTFALAHGVLCATTAWLAIGPGGVEGTAQPVQQRVEIADGWATPGAAVRGVMPAAAPMTAYSAAPMASFDAAAPAPAPASRRSLRDRLLGRRGTPHTMAFQTAEFTAAEPLGKEAVDLAPFAPRVRDLLDRAAAPDRRWARELRELIEDLRSVQAPEQLLTALSALSEDRAATASVREAWREVTGQTL